MTYDADRTLLLIYGTAQGGTSATGFAVLEWCFVTLVPVNLGTRHAAYVPKRDADLLAAYRRTSMVPCNPEADALLAEIERRGLDV